MMPAQGGIWLVRLVPGTRSVHQGRDLVDEIRAPAPAWQGPVRRRHAAPPARKSVSVPVWVVVA